MGFSTCFITFMALRVSGSNFFKSSLVKDQTSEEAGPSRGVFLETVVSQPSAALSFSNTFDLTTTDELASTTEAVEASTGAPLETEEKLIIDTSVPPALPIQLSSQTEEVASSITASTTSESSNVPASQDSGKGSASKEQSRNSETRSFLPTGSRTATVSTPFSLGATTPVPTPRNGTAVVTGPSTGTGVNVSSTGLPSSGSGGSGSGENLKDGKQDSGKTDEEEDEEEE
ncbi:hypothetical protein FALBO_4764, partial [Fusarium albosuccineum]